MANWGNFKHQLSSRTKRSNLYYMVLTTILCSSFYLIGVWQHSRGNVKTTTNLDTEIACNPINSSAGNHQSPAVGEAVGAAVTLDFAPHHTAEDLIPLSPAAREAQFPPCSPSLSEYTPCHDEKRSLAFTRKKLEYRERHCPLKEEVLKCRIPAPFGYRAAFRWPESRDNVWYANVPHKHLTVEKAGQNWVRFEGDRFSFPGGGTMFPRGADAYIDDIGKLINLKDGSVRTAIDTGCGVASWGAYLLSRDILPMSFAPKDTHEAQVQFALERGVPALIGIMAVSRLPYPSRAFDIAHCSRCLIPWAQDDGLYLIEVDRILRPGGYWVLSGPPINWENRWKGWNRTREDLNAEQVEIEDVAKSLCWKKIAQGDGIAVWQKPTNHIHCKLNRAVFKKPLFCENQATDQAWNTKMEACLTPLPEASDIKEYAGGKLANWPERLTAVPPRIASGSIEGITAELFEKDKELWKTRISYYKKIDSQLAESGRYRNLLDMNAYLGGFAAALIDDPVWVMNIVPAEALLNTLGVVYERGLIGTYQNWCEAMSTYPRTYDFIHSDSVFSLYQDRCDMEDILLEMDRVLRPQGSVIFRDDVDILVNVKSIVDGLQWESRLVDHENGPHVREKILIATKQYWTIPAVKQDESGSATTTSK